MSTLKICIDCEKSKELIEFPFDKSRNRYLSVCKKCTSIRTENYRQNNKNKWKEQSKNHSQKRRNVIDDWKSQGCTKCGDIRSYVIDAHHLDPSKKSFSVGELTTGWKMILKELEKCIPLCSNCHREFHYLEKTQKITIKNYLTK